MLKELLGIRSGILEDIHQDHEEADALIGKILEARVKERRKTLFRELEPKLRAHLEAEDKVLYRKMVKASDKEVRAFPQEGAIEHDLVLEQLALLARGRDPLSEDWTARMTVMKELIHHHVREEESEGFEKAREIFDKDALERLGEQFRAEKARILGEDESGPQRGKPARSAAA